tara:strand:+ start:32 stop:220 length:189 start_codon:yes stop_codon:yes gene_type:complete
MVNLSSNFDRIDRLEDDRENILLSVRSKRWNISRAVIFNRMSPRMSPPEKIKNEFLFFICIL